MVGNSNPALVEKKLKLGKIDKLGVKGTMEDESLMTQMLLGMFINFTTN